MASLAEAVAITLTVPETVEPLAGEVIDTVSGVVLVLFTVIDTAGLVALFPAASTATAVRLCLPFASVFVFSDCEYAPPLIAAPRLVPSTWNCTLATATLSEDRAATVIVPETAAPEAGEVIETVGGIVSRRTVRVAELLVTFPAELLTTARKVFPLSVTVVGGVV